MTRLPLITWVLLLFAVRCGVPQSALPGQGSYADLPGRQTTTDLLGPGDTLAIDVADMPEVSTKAVRISSDGLLNLPLAGPVHAAGLSVAQLRVTLAAQLAKYITDPIITINVVTNVSRFVSVVGEVNTPGLHPLDGPRNLLEVISQAGGVKADAGPRVIVTRDTRSGALPTVNGAQLVTNGSSARLTLSLNDLTDSSSPDGNIPVLPGDIVSVPKEKLVYVVGNVHRAGGFPLSHNESMTVLQAMSLAEGYSANASLRGAKILRPAAGSKDNPTEVPIDLQAILAGKAPDRALFADDVLFIPNSTAKSGTRRAAEVMLQVATGIAIYR